MPVPLECTGCHSPLRIPDEFAGKKVKCPKCAVVLLVPDAEPIEGADERIADAPVARKSRPKGREPRREEDEDRPRTRKGSVYFKPCPKCGCDEASRVIWTIWGSFYGPALFTHVRCADCGYKFNGKTGRSNTIPAVIFITVPLLGILGIFAGLGYMIYSRM